MHTLENPLAAPPASPRSTDTLAFIQNQLGDKDAAQAEKLLGKQSEKPTDAKGENWGDEEEPQDLQGLSDEEKQSIEAQKVFQEIISRESLALQKFFGRSFEIPPLPEEATTERIAEWREQGFELQYWPRINMEENTNYPGWKHKPGKRHTPNQQHGIEFYDKLQQIQDLPENAKNPHLHGLSPTELPGAWVLRDTRPKPNYTNGTQTYEDDVLIQGVLQKLAQTGILNSEAADGTRSKIHPNVFQKKEFWKALASALDLDDIPGATVRLPRLIEANVMGQGPGFHDTSTYEWCEEYYQSGKRVLSGHSGVGGASYVDWCVDASNNVGFRPLIIFPSRRA